MGMNFSNLSAALGCEKMGRAPGKVMGMASYAGVPIMDKVHTRHTVAQRCELDALEHSCEIIQRALDMNPDCKNIVLSGGYSLNCTNNYKYMERFPEVTFFVDPAASDAGTAVGASLNLARLLESSTGETE
jgi:predicted NodU family carbamoyl transferase